MRELDDISYAEISCDILKVTEKAVLIFDGMKEVWVPKSLVREFDEKLTEFNDEKVTLFIAEWFCEENELF